MELPKRKRVRLEYYDYSFPGAYFITICTYKRQNIFLEEHDKNGEMYVDAIQNNIIHHWILETMKKFQNAKIVKYVIMPDHIHFILEIEEKIDECDVSDIIRWFKTMTTNQYIRLVKEKKLKTFEEKLWQKSYNDHVIRCNDDYKSIWDYIENNVYRDK